MNLTMETRNVGNSTVLACKGDLTGGAAYPFSETLHELLHQNRAVVLDFAGVGRIDGAALGALASAIAYAQHRGLTIGWSASSHIVQDALKVTGLARLLKSYDKHLAGASAA